MEVIAAVYHRCYRIVLVHRWGMMEMWGKASKDLFRSLCPNFLVFVEYDE